MMNVIHDYPSLWRENGGKPDYIITDLADYLLIWQPCVYVIIQIEPARIVYIGKSKQGTQRFKCHKVLDEIAFEKGKHKIHLYFFEPKISRCDLASYELAFINKFCPLPNHRPYPKR